MRQRHQQTNRQRHSQYQQQQPHSNDRHRHHPVGPISFVSVSCWSHLSVWRCAPSSRLPRICHLHPRAMATCDVSGCTNLRVRYERRGWWKVKRNGTTVLGKQKKNKNKDGGMGSVRHRSTHIHTRYSMLLLSLPCCAPCLFHCCVWPFVVGLVPLSLLRCACVALQKRYSSSSCSSPLPVPLRLPVSFVRPSLESHRSPYQPVDLPQMRGE